jgi:hypothetical protein
VDHEDSASANERAYRALVSDPPRLPEPDDPRELPPQPPRPARPKRDLSGAGWLTLGWVGLVVSVFGFGLLGAPELAIALGLVGAALGAFSFAKVEPGSGQYAGGVAVIVGGVAALLGIFSL